MRQSSEQSLYTWPKVPPTLSAEQREAREKFMQLWHEVLPKRFSVIEQFNHSFVARLPYKTGSKTLEIGAGLGEHLKYEDLNSQEYYCLEYRENFCSQLTQFVPKDRIICGDIQKKQKWDSKTFDRIIAVHVLEHLTHLPDALEEISRLLKDDGYFDIVLPCEGGFAYSLARKMSAQRLFIKNFKMDYIPIVRNEHVSTYREIIALLPKYFEIQKKSYFPLLVPISGINLVAGLRLKKLGSG